MKRWYRSPHRCRLCPDQSGRRNSLESKQTGQLSIGRHAAADFAFCVFPVLPSAAPLPVSEAGRLPRWRGERNIVSMSASIFTARPVGRWRSRRRREVCGPMRTRGRPLCGIGRCLPGVSRHPKHEPQFQSVQRAGGRFGGELSGGGQGGGGRDPCRVRRAAGAVRRRAVGSRSDCWESAQVKKSPRRRRDGGRVGRV